MEARVPLAAQGAAASKEEPRRLVGLGRCLAGLLVLAVFADIAGLAADADHLDLIDRLLAGEDVTFEEATASDDRVASVGMVRAAVFVVTAVVWIVWFRRLYGNVARIEPAALRYGKGWAIGSWLIPVLNLIRPKKMANDIWRGTDPAPGLGPVERRPVSALLHVWWAAWVVMSVFEYAATRLFFQAETLPDQRKATEAAVFTDGGGVLVSLLAIAVVLALTARYERRRVAAAQASQAPRAPVNRWLPPVDARESLGTWEPEEGSVAARVQSYLDPPER